MNQFTYSRLGESFFEEVLPNGLRVRVTKKPGFSRCYAFFAANYGSIDMVFTLGGKKFATPAGVAHYLEHKMFDMPNGNAMEEFSATGASPNAFTSYGMTAYHFECTDHFEENLRILLNFVSTPYFTDESVEKERGIIAQEIRMYEDSPGSCVYEKLFDAMFVQHPIRVPIAGTVESIADITAQTLYDCHRAFYDPSNMMLCVVGDVEPRRIADIACEILPKNPGSAFERDYGSDEPADCRENFVSCKMDVSMPLFMVGFKCDPTEGQEALRRELLADLAAELLMGESSPLYTRLYEEGLIDAGFSCGYEAIKSACLISASGDSRDPQAVRDAIFDEVQRLVREGADPVLFDRLKKSAFGRRLRELDSFEAICYRMAENCFDHVEYYDFPDIYEQLTAEQAVEFLQQTVRPERTVLSVVYPRKKEEF